MQKETGTNEQTNADTLYPFDLCQVDRDDVPNKKQTHIN